MYQQDNTLNGHKLTITIHRKVNKKAVEMCDEHEREGLKAIGDDLINQFESLKTAERKRQKRRRRAKHAPSS